MINIEEINKIISKMERGSGLLRICNEERNILSNVYITDILEIKMDLDYGYGNWGYFVEICLASHDYSKLDLGLLNNFQNLFLKVEDISVPFVFSNMRRGNEYGNYMDLNFEGMKIAGTLIFKNDSILEVPEVFSTYTRWEILDFGK
jgi:hypothetical protein